MKEKLLDKPTIDAYHSYVQSQIRSDLNSVSLGPGRLPTRVAAGLGIFGFCCLIVGILLLALRMQHVYFWDWGHQFVGPFFIILFLLCCSGATYMMLVAVRRSNRFRRDLYFHPLGDYGIAAVPKEDLVHEQELKHDLKSGTTPHKNVMPRSEAYSQMNLAAKARRGHHNQGFHHGPGDPHRRPPPGRGPPPPHDRRPPPPDGRRGPPDDRRRPPDDRRGPPPDRRGPPPQGEYRRGPPPDGRRGPPPGYRGGPDGPRGPPPDGYRRPPPPDDDRRGPPPPGFRGPPPDRRGPPPDNYRGPPPPRENDDRRGPPPREYDDRRGPPPREYDRRGPPPDDRRGPPRGVPHFRERSPDEDLGRVKLDLDTESESVM